MINHDLTKRKFNKLLVIRRNGYLSNGKQQLKAWECICDCGTITTVRSHCLISGGTKSCGCIKGQRQRTHGQSRTKLYRLWADIKKRCSGKGNKKNQRFYFNKGITVYDEWKSFQNFYAWAKDKYVVGLDIDRIDTTRGYSPDNCRFVSRKINAQNKKNCRFWYIRNKRFNSSSDAANHFGVVQSTIMSWCMGKKSGKYKYPPLPNCFTIKKYGEKCQSL